MKAYAYRTAGAAIAAALAAVILSGQQPPRRSTASRSAPTEEFLLLGDATRGAGEPMVAVDPTNPDHVIVVAMSSVQQLYGKPTTKGSTDEYHLVAGSTITTVAVTHDGGATWDVKELPILSGKFTRCPDAFADVTSDGVFLAGCEPRETASDPDFWGMSALVRSTDKGKTWGSAVPVVSDFELQRFAPGLKPVSGGFPAGAADRVASNSPWDRPFTHIDDSTGVIYGVAQGGSAVVDVATRRRRSQAYITASMDGGRSFGTIYSWDSPDYPQQSRGLSATAANGAVVVLYIASSVPAREATTCPCSVVGVSRDRGKTFTYGVVKADHLVAIAADPTHAGRYALLRSDGASYEVAVSQDAAQSWSSFAAAGGTPEAVRLTKPSFKYSREGVLGLMWRAVYGDGSYDIWAAISRDGGATFSTAHRISRAKSPASDPYRNAGLFGDDIQDLAFDRERMHLVWGDSRAGFQGVWYARVPLADFEVQRGQ